MNEALLHLARAAGIEEVYWDGLGIRRELGERTASALLDALGFQASGNAEDQLDTLLNQPFLVPLAPSIVTRSGAPAVVVALPQQQRDETIAWEIALEDGVRISGEFIAAQLQQLEVREIGGNHYARFSLPLPAGLPPGYHQFVLPACNCRAPLIIGPAQCYLPEPLVQGKRCWGVAVQLYTLRSARNWGIGDFSDLASLATAAGGAGADFIGINPLHARHLAHPAEASPYAPSSRLMLDPIYIDVQAVGGFAACAEAATLVAQADFQQRLQAARSARLVDYPAVTALKLPVLRHLHRQFRRQAGSSGTEDFHAFVRNGGEPLSRFCEFEALRLHMLETTGQVAPWQSWPQEMRDPGSSTLAQFRRDAADSIEFQAWLQWVAATQLHAAAEAARAAGMGIGLYRDLAVGAARDSAETWSAQPLFAHGISVGAPPDMLSRQGQSWGLTPWNPQAQARAGYAAFGELLAANMRDAGALRIDHVMALMRLFWIPQGMSGADGGYVRNAFEDLTTILALESVRNRCMVVGEDLGSVPEGLRPRLHENGVLSYRVLVYERHWHGDGRFCRPDEYPPQSLATVATHDMPTITEFWQGGDIQRRAQLGLYPGPDEQSRRSQHEDDVARRRAERDGMLRLLGDAGLSPADSGDAAAVIDALHAAIARTRSMLAVVQLDDVLGEVEPVNVPGTHREYPNWQRRLALPLEDIVADARWERLARSMREAGRG